MKYTAEEKETIIRTDDLMNCWDITTYQRSICTKLRKIKNIKTIWENMTENGTVIAGRYELPLKQISFRNSQKQRSYEAQIRNLT